jgi:predicted phage-related endonuclease
MPETHLKTLKAQVIPSKYYAQVMGNLWITGRKWWDFMSYCPEEDFFITRIERDEDYIAKLEEHLTRVVALIEEGVQAF